MLTLIAIVAAAIAVAIVANWKLQFFRWDLLDEIKEMLSSAKSSTTSADITLDTQPVETPVPQVAPTAQPQRARNEQGQFVGDKPETVATNEAWVGGQAPAKKSGSRRRKTNGKK